MPAILLHDRDEIEAFLRQRPTLHLYELGDLDDFFWPDTTWYALREAGEVHALALLYTGTALPVLLAFIEEEEEPEPSVELLHAIHPFLPRRFYAHLSPGLEEHLEADYRLTSHGVHLKMVLMNQARLADIDPTGVVRLTSADRPALEALYRASYPGNWFDPRMLETGHYVGLWRDGKIVSVAGVHVYSPRYGVAALGNITTHPRLRGQGLATRVTGRLCQLLLETVETVGLNVKEDNLSAIRCYEQLGFARVAAYGEWIVEV
jgi:ribosomal protein S18 acetylase RimI-like enzyme